jgi:hypothetical protein
MKGLDDIITARANRGSDTLKIGEGRLWGQPVWKQGEILRRWRIPPEAKLP